MFAKTYIISVFLCIICFLIIDLAHLSAQNPVYRRYTEDDGLPSNDVYDVLLDKSGLMWFATDNGVSRFDGQKFTNYKISDGLPANSVIRFYQDMNDRIWFLAYNGMLSYYENNEITAYQYNDSIVKYFSDNYVSKILIDSSGNLLLSPRQGGKTMIDPDGRVHSRWDLVPVSLDSCYLAFEDRGDDYFLSILSAKPEMCRKNGALYSLENSYYLRVDFSVRQFQRNYIETDSNEYVVSYRNCIYRIKNRKIVAKRSFANEVLALYKDDQDRLWVSVKYQQGIFTFSSPQLEKDPEHFLDGYTITSLIQDREGDFWFSSEGNGVFFVPGFDFSLFTLPNDNRSLNVMALEVAGDRLWFSTRNKELYSGNVSAGKISNIREMPLEEPYDWIKYIVVDNDGYLWLSSTRHMRYDPAGFPAPADTLLSSKCICLGESGNVIMGSNGIAIFREENLHQYFVPDSSRRVYSLYEDGNTIWIGTLYGLYVLRDGEFTFCGKKSEILEDRISCITRINDMIAVGSSSLGLAFLRNDTLLDVVNQDDGLMGNAVRSLFSQNDSVLWVGTKEGLNKLILNDSFDNFEIESYGYSDGLPSSVINSINIHDGYIWLASNKGLVSFDPDKIQPHHIPPIIAINNVQINGRDTAILDKYELPYDHNDIRINFSGISYRAGEDLRYRYKMSNYIDEITLTKNSWANFPNMPPGEYTFFVNVGNVYGVWNNSPKTIKFVIRKHFTQTAWFMGLLILAFSGLLVGITLFLQRQRRIKEDARFELATMEQKMFRSQMNPHFVFNSLLAIQGFMYQSNTRDAGRYLTSFAKLIRHTLYGSSEEVISLDDEVEAMQYYLELQRLRFNDTFEFVIEIGDDVLPETVQIPPLLIQPFLENAIEHGLQHKLEGGKLRLSFIDKTECLLIEIEDNGIGREESAKIQKKKSKLHKSLGMEIVSKRIKSLNILWGKDISLDIIDLKAPDDRALGTLVRICIPYNS